MGILKACVPGIEQLIAGPQNAVLLFRSKFAVRGKAAHELELLYNGPILFALVPDFSLLRPEESSRQPIAN